MVSEFSVKLKLADKDIPQVSITNIGAYTTEIEGDFVIFGTHSRAVFAKWIKEVRDAGIWFESSPFSMATENKR